MDEILQEPIKLDLQWVDNDGHMRTGKISLTGEFVDRYEEDSLEVWLYRWLDRGYLIYEDYDPRGGIPERTIYPGELDWLFDPHPKEGFTAEEVARLWPIFGEAVGMELERDIDFPEEG